MVKELIEALQNVTEERPDMLDCEVLIQVSKHQGKRIRVTLETPCTVRQSEAKAPRMPIVIVETVGDQF